MANEKAWKDLKDLERSLRIFRRELLELKSTFEQFERVRQDIQSNSERRTQLAALLALHPDLTLERINEEYTRYRALVDWLKENKYFG